MDSLKITTCDPGTNFNTLIHLYRVSASGEVSSNDDDPTCTSPTRSQLRIIAGESFGMSPSGDTMPLIAGEQYMLVVEGPSAIDAGEFRIEIIAYRSPRPKPDLGADMVLCLSSPAYFFDVSSTSQGAVGYQWILNNVLVNSVTGSSFSLDPSQVGVGTHTLIVRSIYKNPNGSICPDTTADTVEVRVETLSPVKPDLGTDTVLCKPIGSLQLNATVPGASSYKWFLNGVEQNFTGAIYSLPLGSLPLDTHVVIVEAIFSIPACGNDTTRDTLEFTILPPRPRPTLGRDTVICKSASPFIIDATTPAALTYQWQINDSLLPDINTPTYSFNLSILDTGTYRLIVRAIFSPSAGHCSPDTTADTLMVRITPVAYADLYIGTNLYPNGSTYTLEGRGYAQQSFTAVSSVSNFLAVWHLYRQGESVPITSDTGRTFTYPFTQAGEYVLILYSYLNYCQDWDTLYIRVNVIQSLKSKRATFKVYPNPAPGYFEVECPKDGDYIIRLMDMHGNVVLLEHMRGRQRVFKVSLPLAVYVLQVVGEEGVESLSLLIME
ncbi:MAG: T9SS type A sorting domain-containing protein [Bacteroidia bacterium]|nr:T9SS type A sorting domain-containing protein [Bacteroidia bacterium]